MKNLIFVDCEATGPCVGKGYLTEFGAVAYPSRQSFHGILYEAKPKPDNPTLSEIVSRKATEEEVFAEFEKWLIDVCKNQKPIFVSDNIAFDWQWINYWFHHTLGKNPFGWSGRRISDFYAGLVGDFSHTQQWKKLRITKHDHNPVNDALGNLEAFERILKGER